MTYHCEHLGVVNFQPETKETNGSIHYKIILNKNGCVGSLITMVSSPNVTFSRVQENSLM